MRVCRPSVGEVNVSEAMPEELMDKVAMGAPLSVSTTEPVGGLTGVPLPTLTVRVRPSVRSEGLALEPRVMVVFSTNLEPSDLADEAFLRRINNKIYIEPVGRQCFEEILARALHARHISCDAPSAAYVTELCMRHGGALKACYPNDLCDILMWRSQYEGRPPQASRAELDRAAELYFARTHE